ncbi:hypothetical protein CANCADRAFT_44889 [Tortispora caseinolytica NRRL Y-17796]|uniref:Copper-fist domain-containing protein n=1 Tax=Tortispora caseinolytica NRRL Y-17796 TaxID=767744 RepID=A0A1E4THR5_9ASCO|nr:hypothetical protein CANCADRAFT_44889 [Tortispora caseinolytica NRRL Y-17796]
MILVEGEKYACMRCIRGHRSSSCNHSRRPLLQVRRRGRPVASDDKRAAVIPQGSCDCGVAAIVVPTRAAMGDRDGKVLEIQGDYKRIESEIDITGATSCSHKYDNTDSIAMAMDDEQNFMNDINYFDTPLSSVNRLSQCCSSKNLHFAKLPISAPVSAPVSAPPSAPTSTPVSRCASPMINDTNISSEVPDFVHQQPTFVANVRPSISTVKKCEEPAPHCHFQGSSECDAYTGDIESQMKKFMASVITADTELDSSLPSLMPSSSASHCSTSSDHSLEGQTTERTGGCCGNSGFRNDQLQSVQLKARNGGDNDHTFVVTTCPPVTRHVHYEEPEPSMMSEQQPFGFETDSSDITEFKDLPSSTFLSDKDADINGLDFELGLPYDYNNADDLFDVYFTSQCNVPGMPCACGEDCSCYGCLTHKQVKMESMN